MKLKIFGTLAVSVLLASCSEEPLTLTAEDVEIDGPLKGAFQLVENTYAVEEDGEEYTVTVEVKRTQESVPFTEKTVNVFGEEALTNAAFGFVIFDEEGNSITDNNPEKDPQSSKQQIKILNLKPGETGKITFTFDKEDKPKTIKLNSAIKFNSTGMIRFDGNVGRYEIKNYDMKVDFNEEFIVGQYQYLTSPAGAYLYLKGKVKEPELLKDGGFVSEMVITEYNSRGDNSSDIWLKLELIRNSATDPYYYQASGPFCNFKGDWYTINLKSEPITDLYKNDNNIKIPTLIDSFYDYYKSMDWTPRVGWDFKY